MELYPFPPPHKTSCHVQAQLYLNLNEVQGFMYGRITLRRIFRKWVGGIKWIDLAQDRDRLLSLVHVVVKLQVL